MTGKKRRFLAVGECMVELAQIGPGTYRRGFAGDTFNTAWYARRLLPADWAVGYLSATGADAVSEEMRGFFREAGIETKALRVVPDRTVGLYMISTKAGERDFSYWRGQSAARLLAEDEAFLTEHLSGAGVVHFSGITLAILPAADRQRLCRAIGAVRAAGTLVSFDTNLRPRLWQDTESMKAGLMLGASVADVVLPSFDEDGPLFGETAPQQTIVRYLDAGAGTVVVKNGAAPLCAFSRAEGAFEMAPRRVERVIDTTAAGDSFAAALMSRLATGQSLKEAAVRAIDLAAAVIQAPGALVPEVFE
ncbi:sugar kinase [Palleronia caenipelagi]|uniref:Sugar kinase n=1 Tax=Palleronia caenipelagi TaxID=2489174 RepID=A0A547PMH1_9RHOB|nr:sugar kinase [Palleronia caenipelagi]